ncbi:DUF5302 domain-containing protein [Thermocatellispora tengchongensis]
MSATPSEPDPEIRPEDAAAQTEGATDPDDELKRKFREALERKRRSEAEANGGGHARGNSKIHGAHGPAAHRRSFRRKSGG